MTPDPTLRGSGRQIMLTGAPQIERPVAAPVVATDAHAGELELF